jgi:hypothetical protein
VKRIAFRGDAAFAQPNMYEFLDGAGIEYAIRLPANQILQERISDLLKRPVGRPAHYVRRFYRSFRYQAASWSHARRVVAKVEWHHGELFPRVGFIMTNLRYASKNVVGFHNQRGTCEQWIKEGKGAIKWTRLSCRTFNANAVRLQLHAPEAFMLPSRESAARAASRSARRMSARARGEIDGRFVPFWPCRRDFCYRRAVAAAISRRTDGSACREPRERSESPGSGSKSTVI